MKLTKTSLDAHLSLAPREPSNHGFSQRGLSIALSLALASSSSHALQAPDPLLPSKTILREPLHALRELLFIDSSVAAASKLLQGIRPSIEVIELKANEDGLQVILRELKQRNNITAVHLVTHGRSGE